MAKAKAKKNKGGRPTKYKSSYCNADKYFKHCKEEKEIPTVCGYAIFLGVSERTLREWRKEHEEFSPTLRVLMSLQKQALINKGLKNEYNSTITKLMLSANHDMIETSGREHKVSEETATLLGMIDGQDKGKLPSKKEK
jgi:hypothetical protein